MILYFVMIHCSLSLHSFLTDRKVFPIVHIVECSIRISLWLFKLEVFICKVNLH